MKKILEKLNDYRLPINVSHLALAFSLLAVGFVASSANTPCLQAQATCASGGNNEFTGNISVKGGTSYKATFDASGISADRTLTIPNADGTLALTSDITPPSYTPDAPFLKVDGSGTAVVGSATADAPFVSVDASGQLDSSATLTASTPLKSSATGQITASDLDITTDITPGTALQQIRTNSGGSSVEWFTPAASGGAYTLIDSGTIIANASSSDETFTCWYGNTLDATKRYKLIFDGGTGFNAGSAGYVPSYVPLEGDCSTGTKNEWEASSYYSNGVDTIGDIVTGEYKSRYNRCFYVQQADSNSASKGSGNIQGQIEFSAVDNGNDYGLWSTHKASAVVTNSAGVLQGQGIQFSDGTCIVWDQAYTNPFSNITGFMFYFEGGFPAPLTRKWALYEIDY